MLITILISKITADVITVISGLAIGATTYHVVKDATDKETAQEIGKYARRNLPHKGGE
ncbi:hypothetical protein [Photobacterium rosenbergii]|uniref:hypothetical protein n=1 Tax=Photobacterium rosenbergii TaxID=294936 RepID=UPI001304A36A|nr:hypothetical protein [Photobacterium rosenbergii]